MQVDTTTIAVVGTVSHMTSGEGVPGNDWALIRIDQQPRGYAHHEHQLRLEDRQIALKLPRSDLDAVVLPLLALDLDVPVEDVLAQRPQDEL